GPRLRPDQQRPTPAEPGPGSRAPACLPSGGLFRADLPRAGGMGRWAVALDPVQRRQAADCQPLPSAAGLVRDPRRSQDRLAPDLIPSWWDDGFLLEQSTPGGGLAGAVERSTSPVTGGVEFAGSHRLEGVFMIAGGPARHGHAFTGARIIDVAPTVLYLMGLP